MIAATPGTGFRLNLRQRKPHFRSASTNVKGGRHARETHVPGVVQCHNRRRHGSLSSWKCIWRRWLKSTKAHRSPWDGLAKWTSRTPFRLALKPEGNEQLWLSRQKTKGLSDVYVQSNVWAPGGSTGWHTHPGHSLIIVTAGTVTNYEGHDPDCKPHVYKTGMAFVDPGGDHVHTIRNEGIVEAKTIAVQFIPADAARRIDVADPGNCHF